MFQSNKVEKGEIEEASDNGDETEPVVDPVPDDKKLSYDEKEVPIVHCSVKTTTYGLR